MESSQFSDSQSRFDAIEQMETQGATCDTFRVKLYGKLHFLKRLKSEYAGDIRYQEALRKEFETGYRLEHPNLVRYISLDNDSILMEYVEGDTLSQRLASNPDYFMNRKNTDKFIRQLLDVIGYLHSHQVLHLDLKPDNILFTRINDDVKLIDLGCSYTDTFPDTTGHTNAYAAPEQLSIIHSPLSIQTDIYAIGKILERLPDHTIYNKVIARCTAEDSADRYQSLEEILYDVSHRRRYWPTVAILVALIIALVIGITLFSHQQKSDPITIEMQKDSASAPVSTPISQPSKKEDQKLFDEELEQQIDKAYHSTIATFCDSVFPSLTVGRQWERESSEFHAKVLQAAADLSRKYPDIPESVVIEHVESRFQNLVSYVFNQMRENGKKHNIP